MQSGDSRFHIELAAVSHSTRLARAEIAIQSDVGELLQLLTEDEVERQRSVSEHHGILDAIAGRDAASSQSLMESHVATDTARLIDLRWELTVK